MNFLVLKLFIICSFIAIVNEGFSQDKVIILNANESINKYQTVQKIFTKNITGVKIIDLGNKWYDAGRVESLLLDSPPDLVFAIGSRALDITYPTLPNKQKLIFTSVINWQRFALTDAMYGISQEIPPVMQLTLFSYFFPKIKKIGVVFSRDYNMQFVDLAQKHAKEMQISILNRQVKYSHETPKAVTELLPDVDALWLISDPVALGSEEIVRQMFVLSNGKNKPIFAYSPGFNELGATFTLSVDDTTIGHQAALIANDLLDGTQPEEHVQAPAGTFVTLNLDKVKQFGLSMNVNALGSVNHLIEK